MADVDVIDLADKLWRGEETTDTWHPVTQHGGMAEVAHRTVFLRSLANITALDTDEGLLLVDTGGEMLAKACHQTLRTWTASALHTAVYSHGHIDHVFGVPVFEEEARTNGWAMPHVIAHEHLPARFDRYQLTNGYNAIINRRQFRMPNLGWPMDYRYPDETYRDHHHVVLGGETFELHHAKGETDDATWVWAPERRVLCTGDLFIFATPNCGNPQKVQRYPREWAQALGQMAELDAEVLLPGHGLPVIGADRVRQALTDTIELLESLVDQALALMNQGARLDELIHSVTPPAHLMERPYLRPVYDEPEFIVRNIWRLYGGWYDGNPATLKPAPEAALALELADLAGGPQRLADRATELAAAGELRLAGHLAELAALAAPDDAGIHGVRAEVFARRAATERSTMARGVFSWAEHESRARAGLDEPVAGDAGDQPDHGGHDHAD
jgi:alkyl sulfatase BDS1-like metallo-beta-lactamase superfamily hydrolase